MAPEFGKLQVAGWNPVDSPVLFQVFLMLSNTLSKYNSKKQGMPVKVQDL